MSVIKQGLYSVVFILAFIVLGYLIYNPFLLEGNSGKAVYAPPKVESIPHYVIGDLKFCSDPWPPYAGDATKPQQGYIVEILKAIYEPLGYVVEFVNVPWSRCIRDTRDGVFHAVAGADVNEVPDFIFPTMTVGVTNPKFFILEDSSWQYNGVSSLENVRLGVIQDYTYSANLDTYIRQHQSDERITIVTGNDPLLQLLNLLQAGRIDVFVENAPVVQHMLEKLGVEEGRIKSAGTPGIGVLLYVPFSPKFQESRELVAVFDRGIKQLRDSGALMEILSRYQVNDWLKAAAKIEKYKIGLED